MNKFIILLMLLTAGGAIRAEVCQQTGLSDVFAFQLDIARSTNADRPGQACSVTIAVSNKLTRTTTQTIPSGPLDLLDGGFKGSDFAQSYTTGKNTNNADREGDFIVADFNFDHRDDFAVKKEWTVNSGSMFDYYIQDEKGQFVRDTFLSDTMVFFPEINKGKKTLKVFLHQNAFQNTETTYRLDAATKKWKVIKSELVGDIPGVPKPDHAWTVLIGGYCFGFLGFSSETDVYYGVGSVEIPFHIYALAGIGSAVPLLVCAIYVYVQRRRHRNKAAKDGIISPAARAGSMTRESHSTTAGETPAP